MPQSLILYHYWRSSCSWRVRWVLAHKQISYQSVPINLLKNEQQSPEYLAKNPQGFVPCLEVDGRILCESPAIIEWLEESYPQMPLLPRDPWARAQAREIASIIATGIQPLQNLKAQRQHTSEPEAREAWARHWIETGMLLLENKLRDRSGLYCVGDDLSLADIFLIPQVYNALRYQVPMENFPRVSAIYQLCLSIPACEAAAPHRQEGATTA